MKRRIFSITIVLSFLTFVMALLAGGKVSALTPTISPIPSVTPTSMPGADFAGTPLSGATPLTVQFTALNSSILSSCKWTFGDGTSQSFAPPASQTFSMCPSTSHVYGSGGSYTVSLMVIKATNGFSNTMTKTNYIQVSGPTATPTAITDVNISGFIQDTSSGVVVPIPGATIQAGLNMGRVVSATSAADGSYHLLLPAAYVVGFGANFTVSAPGYATFTASYSEDILRTYPSFDFVLGPNGTPSGPTLTPTRTPTSTSVSTLPDLTVSSITYIGSNPTCANNPKVQVVVANIGASPANGSFSVSLNGSASQTVNGLAAGQSVTLIFNASSSTATADSTNVIAETNESNNSLTGNFGVPTQAHTCTPTGPTLTATRTPTRTPTGPTPTRTRTPTATVMTPDPTPIETGGCSPVTSSITAPFTFDGAGTFCWQASNLGTFINSWNTTSVTLNSANVTNLWMSSGSYPAKINGFWYVSYNSASAFGHFEAKP